MAILRYYYADRQTRLLYVNYATTIEVNSVTIPYSQTYTNNINVVIFIYYRMNLLFNIILRFVIVQNIVFQIWICHKTSV